MVSPGDAGSPDGSTSGSVVWKRIVFRCPHMWIEKCPTSGLLSGRYPPQYPRPGGHIRRMPG